MTTWNEIWKNRKANTEKLEYEELLKINGYDGKQSNLNPQNLEIAHKAYERYMRLQQGDSIYEVACGAGAFLYSWSKSGHSVGGCDLSENLINCAKASVPSGDWTVASAADFPVGQRWDHLVSFSLCMYLSDVELKNLITRMIMKANYSISLFDIPDFSKMAECENERRRLIPDYDNKYAGLSHYYHKKGEIIDYLESMNLSYSIYNQDIPGYENGKWRFNLTVTL